MKRVFSCLIGFMLALYILATPSSAASFRAFYVAPNGSDNADGSIAHPFATIERAQEAVREINQSANRDIYVYLREGTYILNISQEYGAGEDRLYTFETWKDFVTAAQANEALLVQPYTLTIQDGIVTKIVEKLYN